MIITPKQLAHRWNCSVFHIYKLCREELIPHFRVGNRIIRFKLPEIEAYECRNSSSTEESGASTAVTPMGVPSGNLLEPQTEPRQNAVLQTYRPSTLFVPPLSSER